MAELQADDVVQFPSLGRRRLVVAAPLGHGHLGTLLRADVHHIDHASAALGGERRGHHRRGGAEALRYYQTYKKKKKDVWNLTDKHLDVVDGELSVRHPAGQQPEIYSFPNAVFFLLHF